MRVMALVLIRSGLNLLIFGTILAVLSYVRTENFRKRTGVNPWNIPPLMWAIASFFVIVLGTLLSIIACATTKVPARNSRWMGSAGHPGAPGQVYPPGAGSAPSYGPVPSGTYPPGTAVPYAGTPVASSPVDAPLPPFQPAGGVAATSPPRWFADPTGRHEYRYWDGEQWSEHVSDHGTSALDPVSGS
jgi:hypothetical protein